MRAQMPQPQLIEDFLVLLIERRPLAAIHQVPEQEQLPKMRPSRLDQTVVENRGKIERAFQYNAVGFHRDEEVVQLDDRREDAFVAHRSRKVEQHDIVSFFGDGGPFPPFRHRLGRFAAENTIRFHPFVLGERNEESTVDRRRLHDGLVAVRKFEDGVLRVVAVHHRDADAVQVVQPRGGQHREGRFADAPFLGGESDAQRILFHTKIIKRLIFNLFRYADTYLRIHVSSAFHTPLRIRILLSADTDISCHIRTSASMQTSTSVSA